MEWLFWGKGSLDMYLYSMIFFVSWMLLSMGEETKWSFVNAILVTSTSYFIPMVFCASIFLAASILMAIGAAQAGNDMLELFNGPRAHQAVNGSYRTPEFNADGTIVAYRYFIRDEKGYMSITKNGLSRNGGSWPGGYLESDRVPTLKNTNGIYAAKTADSPILEPYRGQGYTLAKVELSGRVIEAEFGYRAQRCIIIKELEES